MKCSATSQSSVYIALLILLQTVQLTYGAVPVFTNPDPNVGDSRTIPENTISGIEVYTLEATDADDLNGSSITYALVSQVPADPQRFDLDGAVVKTSGPFDYESGITSYNLTFSATTVNGSVSATLTIYISDDNDEIPVITGSFTANIEEEQALETIVPSMFTANDKDANDILRYSISGDDLYFEINKTTGEIRITQRLDYDSATKTTFLLTVTVRDAADNSATQTLTIHLQNKNDNPPVFLSPDGTSIKRIPETTVRNTPIYTIEARDADKDDISYQLINQVPSGKFRFDGTTLYTDDALDFEKDPIAYNLTFTATSEDDSVTAELSVIIEDVNDETPTITGPFTVELDEEKEIGTVVPTTYNVSDLDADDVLKYGISGDDDIFFSIDSSSGKITTHQRLDYESLVDKTFLLTLTVRDAVGHSATQTLTINLQNVDDNDPYFINPLPSGGSTKTLPETIAQGTSIFTIEAKDPDGENVDYTMSQEPSNPVRFGLFGRTVQTISDFDYEAGPHTYILSFSATSAGKSVTANLTVLIEDVNDETPIITGSFTIELDEEETIGTIVPTAYTVDDLDANDALRYSISGNGDNFFDIDRSTGTITIKQKLDYELLSETTFFLTITVRDNVDHSATQTLTINLQNIDDNGPVFINPLSSGANAKSLPENIEQGSIIFTIEANDADGDNVDYNMSQDPPNPVMFILVGTVVQTSNRFDYETGPNTFRLTFSATSTTNTETAMLTVNIEDVIDEPPVFRGVFNAEIDENEPRGIVVPTNFSAYDSDANDILQYYIIGESSYFEIDSASGQIRTTQKLDYESISPTTFFLTVAVIDKAQHTASQVISITLRNINDNELTFLYPQQSGGSSTNIPETIPARSLVYTIEAEDLDDEPIEYFLSSQDPVSPQMFELVGRNLYTLGNFDYETGPRSYRLTFNATTSIESTTAVLSVTVNDVNDEIPILTGPFSVNIIEELPRGSVVPSPFTANDADQNDVLLYSFIGDNENFHIDVTTGVIHTRNVLDFDTAAQKTFLLTVVVTDDADHTVTELITINVTNINDNDPEFTPNVYYSSVQENTAEGIEVEQLTVQDADGDTLTLVITSGDDFSTPKFALDDKRLKTSGSSIDYENLSGQNYEYALIVTASDSQRTATATVYVTITGQNEFDPVWSAFQRSPVLAENALIGTTIVTVLATDADDGADGIVLYSIDSVSSKPPGRPVDNLFHLDEGSGALKTTSSAFDRDIATGGTEYYNVTVRAMDQGGRFVTETITVSLSDVNDNAPVFTDPIVHVEITETDGPEQIIREMSATDADDPVSLTYTLDPSSTPASFASFFALEDGNKIKLKTTIDLDPLSADDTFHLIVKASDGGNPELSGTTTIVVTVTAVNEHTPVLTGPYHLNLSESTAVDSDVIQVSATDADGGFDGEVFYSITGGNTEKYFSINPSTGVITLSKALDYETTTNYGLTIKANDGGNPSLENSTTLRIDILDVNDNLPTCVETSMIVSILETLEENAEVAQISCQDSDAVDTVVYNFKSGDQTVFRLDVDTGELTLKRAVDYDTGEVSFALVIGVISGMNSLDVSVSVTVNPVNEHTPVFNRSAVVTLPEDIAVGETINSLLATDDDASPHDIVRYQLNSVSNGGTTLFSISQSTGVIRVVESLDYEKLTSSKEYIIQVLAIDGGSPSKTGTGTLTVRVTDVNDNAPVCTKSSYALIIAETQAIDSVIISDFGCSDNDNGTTLQYSLSQKPVAHFRISDTMPPQLLLNSNLNYVSYSNYILTFEVTDGEHTVEVDIDIVISDENNGPPVFPELFYSVVISETASVGTTVITIAATDPDGATSKYGKLVYTLSVNKDNRFNIDPNFGTITVAGALDAETTSVYMLEVQAAEVGGSNIAIATCNVTIEDANDNKPTCSEYSFSLNIPESTSIYSAIKTLSCSDSDVSSNLQYSVSAGETTLFQMNHTVLQLIGEVDYEAIQSDAYSVTIDVSDGTNIVRVSGVITFTGVNEDTPIFNPGIYKVSKAEDLEIGSTIVTVTASDRDRGETVTYSLITVNDEFRIEPVGGQIVLMSDLDREKNDHYKLVVQATDGLNSVSVTVNVTVEDVNDNTPKFSQTSYSITIPENTAAGNSVITVTARDEDDPNSPHQYGLVQYSIIETFNAFAIDPVSGVITTTININYEDATFYTLTVRAYDSNDVNEAKSSTAIVTVVVSGINEHKPEWATFNPAGTTFSIPENSPVGSSIVTISATDGDIGIHGLVLYSLGLITTNSPGKVTTELFHLDQVSGVLTTTSNSLDRDIASGGIEYYDIEVRATDQGGLSANETIRVLLSDVNDNTPEFSETVYNVQIRENDTAGTIVKVLTASDVDDPATLTYFLDESSTPSSFDTYFSLEDVNTIKLKATVDLDPPVSATEMYHLVVKVTDGGIPERTGSTTVLVTVVAINEETPTFTESQLTLTISESMAVGEEIVILSAIDGDIGVHGIITYSITGGNTDKQFNIHPSTGIIKVAKVLDFETKSQYILTVSATDGGSPPKSSTTEVTINLLDESDNVPTCLETLITTSVPETKKTGDEIAELGCEDKDKIDTITYSLKSGDSEVFQIDEAGIITLKRDLDFDTGDNYFALTINVKSGDDTIEVFVSVTVTAVNEHPPVFIDGNVTVTLPEDTEYGTTVATMEAQDGDAYPHDITSYTIKSVSNSGGGLFSVAKTTGVIQLRGSLDFESLADPKEYVIRVIAVDGGMPTAQTGTGTLTVSVQDVNDNLPVCSQSSYVIPVPELTAIDVPVIPDFGCNDADAGTSLTYSLIQAPFNHFKLNTTPSVYLAVASIINYGDKNTYQLTLSVSDGTHTTEIDIAIIITDVNNGGPTFLQANYTGSVSESASVGTSVTTVTAEDPDAITSPYGQIIYTLINNLDNTFHIDKDNGKISTAGHLDAENVAEYTLVVQASEAGGTNSATVTCAVTIIDENDNSPTCTKLSFSLTIPETTSVPANLTTLRCDDKDITSTLQYSISTGNDGSIFRMDENVLQLIKEIDYDTSPTDIFMVVVDVSDGTNVQQISGTIKVSAENEAMPEFTQEMYLVTKAEDIEVGSTIMKISAVDSDKGDVIRYTMVTLAADYFSIDGTTGEIILQSALDREIQDSHEIVVQASDGIHSAKANVTIAVSDVNDNAPSFESASYSATVPENTAPGFVVITVRATDLDDPGSSSKYGAVRYSILNTNDVFVIEAVNGNLSTIKSLDYEADQKVYTLFVQATDSDGGPQAKSSTVAVTIVVGNENEAEPKFTQATYAAAAFENTQVGTTLLKVSAEDSDDGDDGIVVYSMAHHAQFYLDAKTGDIILKQSLDYESVDKSFQFEVVAKDSSSTSPKSSVCTVSISVTDINDNQPKCDPNMQALALPEDASAGTSVAQLNCNDADSDEITTLLYTIDFINNQPSAGMFAVDPQGLVTLESASLDYELLISYSIIVKVVDDDNEPLSTTATVQVDVTDVNEYSPEFLEQSYNVSILENYVSDTPITNVHAEDQDINDVIMYYIQPSNAYFKIDSDSGDVFVVTAIDFEPLDKSKSVEITIYAQDNGLVPGSKSTSTTLTINIQDTNDGTPVFTQGVYYGSLSETSQVEMTILRVVAHDSDNDTLSYELHTAPNTFRIEQTGDIVLNDVTALDYDSNTKVYHLIVKAADQRGNTGTTTVYIGVVNENEHPPIFIEFDRTIYVAEDAENNQEVIIISATDADHGDDGLVSYSILSGADGKFSVDEKSGRITVSDVLNREAVPSYTLTISAYDHGVPQQLVNDTLTIEIVDVNDESPVCDNQHYSVAIPEDISVGQQILTLTCNDNDNDPNGNNSLIASYIITSGNSGEKFEVLQNGIIQTKGEVDRETEASYNFMITISDSGIPALSTTVTVAVQITDVNDNDPVFEEDSYLFRFPENASIGTVIGSVHADDVDEGAAGRAAYTIINGNENGKFAVDEDSGELILTDYVDFDTPDKSFNLDIMARNNDGSGRNSTVRVAIELEDVNDNSPICSTSLYTASVAENESVTVSVVQIECSDADSFSSPLLYIIASGNEAGYFEIGETSGLVFIFNPLDAETQTMFDLTVDVSDATYTTSVKVRIIVIDVNEHPPVFSPVTTITVPEDISVGSTLYTFTAQDDDASEADLLFTLVSGNPQGHFTVDVLTGVLQLQKPLDRETVSRHNITVRVADGNTGGALFSETELSISVEDVNDNYPVCDKSIYTITLPEDSLSQVVVSPACNDKDISASPQLLYQIVSGNDEGKFEINPDNGQINLLGALDYETTATYEFMCAVDDQGSPKNLITTIKIIIYIEPINEYAPNFIDIDTFDQSIEETTPVGTAFTEIKAIDLDKGANHDAIRFSLSSGNDNNQFAINSVTGWITLLKALDYETRKDYSLLVSAKDSLGSAEEKITEIIVHINVIDTNDNEPRCLPALVSETYDEAFDVGNPVTQLKCVDNDTSTTFNSLNYNILSVNGQIAPSNQFTVSNTGILTLASEFDFENTNSFHILIRVSDNGPSVLSTTVTVQITVNDVNEHNPIFDLNAYTSNLNERATIGSSVITVKATDNDINDRITYHFEDKSVNFEIDPISGTIYLVSKIDYDTMGSENTIFLTVIARDNGINPNQRSSSVTVNITVINENDGTPTFVPGVYASTISENNKNEHTVTTVTATDIDNTELNYFIISGNTDNIFRIDKIDFKGVIVIDDASLLDYERKKAYSLVVHAVDAGDLTGTTTVAIEVTGYNEFIPELPGLSSTKTIPENSGLGSMVLDLDATDDDEGLDGELVYSLTAGAMEKFAVDQVSGKISVVGPLDRETTDSYTLEITVTDKGEKPGPLSMVYTLTVAISDVNDVSPVCSSSFYSVNIKENAAIGSTIAQLECSDADSEAPNNEIGNYIIIIGNEGGEFNISDTGFVHLAMNLDYEIRQHYELIFEIIDAGTPPLTTTTTLGITVTDENDNPPEFTENPYHFQVPEDAAIGESIGTIIAHDADVEHAGRVRYSFVSGNEDGAFAIDSDTGILYVAKALDYDSEPKAYTLMVRASDISSSPLSAISTVQISLLDVNDNYPSCTDSLYSGIIAEDAAFQTNIVAVVCDDVDSINNLTYLIVDGNIEDMFIIDAKRGDIFLAKDNALDAETLSIYDLTIQVSDGMLFTNITVVITIQDVNDIAPVFNPTGPYQIDLIENATVGHTLITLSVSDDDVSPTTFMFAIASGNEQSKFSIGALSGVLQLQKTIDREELQTPIYNLAVTVSDGSFTATASIVVNVLDVNDNYPVCDQMSYTAGVPETTSAGETVFAPICNDLDSTTDLHFQIISGNDEDRFLVDEDDGKVKLRTELDYETTTSYSLTITVSDQGSPALTSTLSVKVFVEAINEFEPKMYGKFNVSLHEDAAINQVVASIYANDLDRGLNHADIYYSIKNGNNLGLFHIHPSNGIVTLRGRLDYEMTTTHILTVTANDMSPTEASRKSSEEILSIHVIDVNDNYPVFNPPMYAVEINEDTVVGTTVVELSATDADAGLSGTDGLQFNIMQGNTGSVFSLSGWTIVLAANIDAATKANYILIISASDQGVPVLTSNTVVSIYVKAVNEYAPLFAVTNDTVVIEESINLGEVIYEPTANDDDTGIYKELRFYIKEGNKDNLFTVDLYSGTVSVANALDFETHSTPYVLTLEVEDTHESLPGVTRTGSMTLTIIVEDVNDEIPIFEHNTYSPEINENVPVNTYVETVKAFDKDSGKNGNVSYHIVSGNGIDHFSIDSQSGVIRTAASSEIDYEKQTNFDLIVEAKDNGTPQKSSSCLVQITVVDLNDETPEFEVQSFVTSITEQLPINTFVTTVHAVDKDSIVKNNNIFTYSFSPNSAYFKIDQDNGDIVTTAILDREIENSHTLVVFAIDQGPNPNTGSTTVIVQVVDINDNGPEIKGGYDTQIPENSIPNTEVFLIDATDKDEGENGLLTYNITGGNTDEDFKIDTGTGNIQVYNTLDRERTEVYYLEVTVTDNGDPTRNAIRTATVTITDINDNPPVFDKTVYYLNISEDVPTDSPVGRLTATDADIGLNGALRYTIGKFIHGNSAHFKVDPATGVISTNAVLDRESADRYVFIYRAFDGGSDTQTATTTVSITVGDFDDHNPSFGNATYIVNTLENQPVGTSILTVVTSDKDFGHNAQIILTIDTSNTQGVRANQFIAINSTTSLLSVKQPINRETDPSFSFILIATDGGAVPLTATSSILIVVDDVNDERPTFSPTFYNAEIAYNDDCAVTVTTLTATDKDYGVNAEFKYGFTLNPVPHLFSLEQKSGAITLIATANPYSMYVLYAEAVDAGSPPLTSNGVTIRIDTFSPNEHVISFHLEIDKSTYLVEEENFLRQLTTVFDLSYPNARVKRWCIKTVIRDNPLTMVHLYVIKDNATDVEAALDLEKEFLTSSEAFTVVSEDDAGTPSNNIKGNAWDVFGINRVEKYYAEEIEESPPFFSTAAGVAVIVIIVLILVAVLTICAIFGMRKIRKHNLLVCFNQIEHGEDDAGDHVARNQYLTKTYEKKPLPPIPYYDKNNLPHPVVALPMPSSTKKVPMQTQNQIYEKPKDLNFYGDLIGFRPGSGVGTRLIKHPERLRPASPASIPELPPIRKLPSLISRPPSFAPMKDVSLREETPREYDESMRTIDDETVSLSTTKEFDGRAVDPVTGRVYEYSTRTHERRWVNESEMGSHFKLKTDGQ